MNLESFNNCTKKSKNAKRKSLKRLFETNHSTKDKLKVNLGTVVENRSMLTVHALLVNTKMEKETGKENFEKNQLVIIIRENIKMDLEMEKES